MGKANGATRFNLRVHPTGARRSWLASQWQAFRSERAGAA
jgi:hypothetical protein